MKHAHWLLIRKKQKQLQTRYKKEKIQKKKTIKENFKTLFKPTEVKQQLWKPTDDFTAKIVQNMQQKCISKTLLFSDEIKLWRQYKLMDKSGFFLFQSHKTFQLHATMLTEICERQQLSSVSDWKTHFQTHLLLGSLFCFFKFRCNTDFPAFLLLVGDVNPCVPHHYCPKRTRNCKKKKKK